MLYIGNYVPFKHRPDLEPDEIESVCIEICFKNTKSFLLNFIYSPPNETQKWIDKFDALLAKFEGLNFEYHILGDFNFKYIADSKFYVCKMWSKLY